MCFEFIRNNPVKKKYAFVSNVCLPSGFDNLILNIQLGALYDWLEPSASFLLAEKSSVVFLPINLND